MGLINKIQRFLLAKNYTIHAGSKIDDSSFQVPPWAGRVIQICLSERDQNGNVVPTKNVICNQFNCDQETIIENVEGGALPPPNACYFPFVINTWFNPQSHLKLSLTNADAQNAKVVYATVLLERHTDLPSEITAGKG